MKKWKKRVISCVIISSMVISLGGTMIGEAHSKTSLNYEEASSMKKQSEKEKKYKKYLKTVQRKNKQAKFSSAASEKTMIANDYLEFMVDDDGRYTIGNVEGNPDYASDDGEILLFGHSRPGTSFSTVRIKSSGNEVKDLIFCADSNVYDTENKMVTSAMTAQGSFESGETYNFIITQYLEFVTGNRGIDDMVKISYKIENNSSNIQKAGVRIMLDTMLANNDDAPFKVLGHGNVTSELELKRDEVPSSYQVYDNLDKPTTFATGSLYLGDDRIPDKIQFARWDEIFDTLYDYEVGSKEFGDSAVAVYFNPVNIEPTKSTSVCTYYGVNSNLLSEGNAETVDGINGSQYGVLVYDSLSQDYISGAEVTIEDGSVITDENGLAVFDNCGNNNGKNVTVTVRKEGYKKTEVPRSILCGSFTGVGLVSQNIASQEPSVLSAVMQSGITTYDLLTTYVYYDEADGGETANDSIIIRVANAGTANIYRLVQGGNVKYESTDGTFTIPIVTKDKDGNAYVKPRIVGLSAGQDVVLEMVSDGFGVKDTELGIRISAPTFSTTDTQKGSISVGDKLEVKIPDNVPVLGGIAMDFGIVNPLPIKIKAEESGKFRVALGEAVNDSSDKDAWDKFEKSYNDMLDKIEDVSKLEEYAKAFGPANGLIGGPYGAGPVKLECKLVAYGEGIADSNGNLNIELGIIVELKEEKDFTHYFFVGGIPVYINVGEKGEIATQIKGNLVYGDGNFSFVGGDCTINPSFQLRMELGVGVKGAVSVSGEGSAKINWLHRFTNNYNKVWLSAALTGKLKCLMFETKVTLDSPELTIYDSNNRSSELRKAKGYKGTSEDASFELSKRQSDETPVQTDNLGLESMYTDIQEITANGKRYRFYLADDNSRTEVNRTTIAYQEYIDDEWTTPVALSDDGTADFDFDLATDGTDIYIVWENLNRAFDGNVTLSEMIEACQISLCKLNTDTGEVKKLYDASDDQRGDFLPTITITSDQKIKIAWYSNASNDIFGNATETEEDNDSIYYVEIPVNQTNDTVETKHTEIENGHVMSLTAGCLNEEDVIIYALDEDGDFSTEQDISLHKLKEGNAKALTDAAVSTNAKFAVMDGCKTMFYYSAGNVAYTTTGEAEDTAYVFNKEALPSGMSDRFSIISNEDGTNCRILWKYTNEEDEVDIYAVNYQNGKWSKPYFLTKVHGTDVSIPSGCFSDEKISLSYGYINDDSEAVIKTETIQDYTDISLDGVVFNQEDVVSGSDMDFKIQLSNTGLQDVSSVCVEVFQNDSIIKSQNIDTDLEIGETVTCEVSSAFFVPEELEEVSEYKVLVYAEGEKDKMDNEQSISIGYTDVSIEENGRFIAAGNEYIALKVSNQSNFKAQDVRMKVLADSLDGTVIYDKYIGKLEAGAVQIYNININQLSNSRVAYALVSSESKELYSYNNTELLAVNPYLKEVEATTFEFVLKSLEGGQIVIGTDGVYESGAEISIVAKANSGYKFVGWEAESGSFKDASNPETTFVMPGQDVTVIAKFQKDSQSQPSPTNSQNNSGIVIVGPLFTPAPTITPTSEPTEAPTVSPTETPITTPEPTRTPDSVITPDLNGDTDAEVNDSFVKKLKRGSRVTDKKTKAVYKITGTGSNKTVEYVKSTKKNAVSVTIPNAVKLKGKTYKVISVGKNAFRNSKKLKTIKIGKNVKTIGKNAFLGCKMLTNVTIGRNVTMIGANAFSKCSALTIVSIPSKVKKIGTKAFYQCKNLQYIHVKTNKLTLKNIGKDAFSGGYNMPRVKTDKSKWKKYSNIFISRGMSGKALFVINPVKLVI